MCPYFDDNEVWARVTEVVAAGDCEADAALTKDYESKSPRLAHVVALPGTLTHFKIENHLRRRVGLEPLPFEEVFGDKSSPDRDLWRKVLSIHLRQKEKDPNAITSYMTLKMKAEQCFRNYQAFINDYADIMPLRDWIEGRVKSKLFKYAGTADLIATVNVKGRVEELAHLSPAQQEEFGIQMPLKKYFLECNDENCPKFIKEGRKKIPLPKCKCETRTVATLVDWKTSSSPQGTHKRQLSAYHWALEEMGVWDEMRNRGYLVNWNVWSVLLGEHSYATIKTPYQLRLYEPFLYSFLGDWGSYNNAKLVARNKKGDVGIKGKCMFCPNWISCPDRLVWQPKETQRLGMVAFNEKEIKKLGWIIQNLKNKNLNVDDLLEKIDLLESQINLLKYGEDNEDQLVKDIKEFVEK